MAPQPPPTHTATRRAARCTRPEVTARERNSALHESSPSAATAHARSHRRNGPLHPDRSAAVASHSSRREPCRGLQMPTSVRSNRTSACRRQHHLGQSPDLTSHAGFASPPLRRPGPRCRRHGAGLKLARLKRCVLVHANHRLPRAFQASAHTAASRGSRRSPALPTSRSSPAFRPAAASARWPHPLPLRS